VPIIDSRDDRLDVAKDIKRHQDKIREAVKKRLPEILSEEEIITSDTHGKKIKVPIKSMTIPDFRQGKRNKKEELSGGSGVGQGPGKKGDTTGDSPGDKDGEGQGSHAGTDPGKDIQEEEFTIEEIMEMVAEDMGLPNLLKKELATIEVTKGYKLSGSLRAGPMVLLQKRPTVKNAIKNFWGLMSVLADEFKGKRSELDCFAALKRSGGALYEAENILRDPRFRHRVKRIDPFPIVGNNDLRFFEVKEDSSSETNALVIAVLDVSGSMSTMKKYIARAILYWMVQILRSQYTRIEIRFITHHETAKLVEEKEFFSTKENGGTKGHSAFSLINDLIKEKYPTSLWNVYVYYFSDGDDSEISLTAKEMKKMMDSGINFYGFANIKEESENLSNPALIDHIKDRWPVVSERIDGLEFITGEDGFPFLLVTINNKKHVYPVLRQLLKRRRK
jgi:uncharacterized sporulation protein YeaH/YhbH (DUF444 family)